MINLNKESKIKVVDIHEFDLGLTKLSDFPQRPLTEEELRDLWETFMNSYGTDTIK